MVERSPVVKPLRFTEIGTGVPPHNRLACFCRQHAYIRPAAHSVSHMPQITSVIRY